MEYVIAALLVLLLVAGFITFVVVKATRRPEETPVGTTEPADTRPESERLANRPR